MLYLVVALSVKIIIHCNYNSKQFPCLYPLLLLAPVGEIRSFLLFPLRKLQRRGALIVTVLLQWEMGKRTVADGA